MFTFKSKKQFFLLPLIAALLMGVFVLLQPSAKESAADSPQVRLSLGVVPVVASQFATSEAFVDAHPADCAHCNLVSVEEQRVVMPVLSTKPQVDSVFKGIAASRTILNRADFGFLKGSQVGQSATFNIGDQTFEGAISLVREGERSSTYAINLEDGTLAVTIDRNDEFQAFLMFNGDSRVVKISLNKEEGFGGNLLASEITVSDVLCAPTGAVYPLNGPQPVNIGAFAPRQPKEYPALTVAAAPVVLDSIPGAEHVLYCDFDGEVVTDDLWNTYSGLLEIDADPHPRVNEDAFVTAIWQRVVEDFAPFNITVTTDRAVYDAADPEQRLHAIITPTDDAAPGRGGVAFPSSYQNSLSRIVWIFHLDEYFCASTISHEAGHAFGLGHDGPGPGPAPFTDYYGGHNAGYTPGWAPIMGAFENDQPGELLLDEVDQWSRGEYTDANNQEDDVAIIGGGANGFGFKDDDYADAFDAGGGVDVGLLAATGENQVGATGLISRSVDVDVFRFSAIYTGDITLTVSPLDVQSTDSQPGSSTQGANLAVQIRLLDENGALIATGVDTGAVELASEVQAYVEAGIYYLEVQGAGRGSSGIDGFTGYASLGEYTVVGALPTPPLAVFGGGKTEHAVLLGDTSTQVVNGTNFGFSYPAASQIVHTFMLKNTESTDLTNVSVSLASGIDFKVVSSPSSTIPANTAVSMSIAYDPLQSGANGIDSDTVNINYEAGEVETFGFAVSGTSTLSANRDNYEDNDIWTEATDLTNQEDVWLSNYKGLAFFRTSIRDMYEIAADNDELITVEVAYDSTEGPITFILENDFQVLGSTSDENGIIQFRVPLDFSGRQKDIVITASNTADSSVYNAYDMRWSSIPLSAGDDDLYEENDTQDQAFDLTGAFSTRLSEYLGEGISKDADWYKITVPADPFVRMLYVAAEFTHADGDINIEVVDENGLSFLHPLTSATENDREVVTLHHSVATADFAENFSPEGNTAIMGVEPGIYYVRVYGDFAGNSYDLVVKTLIDDRYEVVDVVDGEDIENDDRENAFFLGDTIIDKWLYEVDGIGTCAAYGTNATQENFTNSSDTDWYEFNVDGSAEQVTIELTSFDGGVMIFQLYDSEFKLLAKSTEPIAGGPLILNSDLMNIVSVDTTYFLRVDPFNDISALSGYDFRVSFSTETPDIEGAVEDNYEQNDNFRELFNLTSNEGFWLSSIDGYGTQLDPDWFLVTVPEGATQFTVKCSLNAAEGSIYLDLSRKDGPTVATTTGGSDLETIVIDDPTPGQYAIAVLGENRGNNYNFFWDVVLEDDEYEENDTQGEAFDLSATERTWLRKVDGVGIQKDEDWYKVTVPENTAELQIFADFDHAAGDIDLELYNAGGYLIARSVSTTDDESITMALPESGEYYIQLHYGDAGNEYDLWWAAFNSVELDAINNGQDAYEENDNQGAAYVLGSDQVWLSDLEGLATQSDDDWFQITIDEGNLGLDVDVIFTHADGDIDVEIYDSLGSVLVRSYSVTDNEIVDFNAPLVAGTYWVRVYGSNVGNEYDLYWLDRTEDIYEQNNTRETAYDLSQNRDVQLSALGVPTQGDDDWYQILLSGDDPYLYVQLDYIHVNGSIDFGLYNNSGTLLQEATSTDDSEYIFRPVAAGTYFIKVYGDDLHSDYDLLWNVYQDDEYEQNDDSGAAYDITSEIDTTLNAASFDDDWYVVTVTEVNSFISVLLSFDDADGNIDLDLYDDLDLVTPIASSAGMGDTESVSIQVAPGDYYIQVTGDLLNPSYDLIWSLTEDDVFEQNDDVASAKSLLVEGAVNDAVQLDDDWFIVTTEPGDVALSIDLTFVHADGNLGFDIYDSSNTYLTTIDTTNDVESTIYGSNPAGEAYRIRVFGPNIGSEYSLVWSSSSFDLYERDGSNNSFDEPADINSKEATYFSDGLGYATLTDEDWYLIDVVGDSVVIEAFFTHANGNIDIELFDAVTEQRLAFSTTDTDGERIVHNTGSGQFVIRVFGDLNGNSYDLFWNGFTEDDLDTHTANNTDYDNDSPEAAITVVNTDAARNAIGIIDNELDRLENLTQLDDDYYVIEVASGDGILVVDCAFTHASGNIDLSLSLISSEDPYIASVAGMSNSTTDDEQIRLDFPTAGKYMLHVSGSNLANEYSLLWNSTSEDAFEENDLSDDTTDFGLDYKNSFSGTQFDEDWYRFDINLNEDYRLLITMFDEDNKGELNIAVYDSNDLVNPIEDLVGGTSPWSIEVFGDLPATYYIKVYGSGIGGDYGLGWRTFVAGLDDAYEVNNSIGEAYDLSGDPDTFLSDIAGTAFQGDPDYFKITVPEHSVHVNLECLLDGPPESNNLTVALLDNAGVELDKFNVTGRVTTLSVTVGPEASVYYILVDGDDLLGYDLKWSYDNADNYEENNISDDAFDLTPQPFDPATYDNDVGFQDPIYSLVEYDGHATQTDDDWYKLQVPSWQFISNTETLTFRRLWKVRLLLDLGFDHADGDIDVEVYDGNDLLNPIAAGTSVDDNESLIVTLDPNVPQKEYYIRVFGKIADTNNSYSLTWDPSDVDAYEVNNFVEEAYDLTDEEQVFLSTLEGYGTQYTDDWYAVAVSAGSSTLHIDCSFTDIEGNIDVEVYRLDPVVGALTDVRKPVLVERLVDTVVDGEEADVDVSSDVDGGIYFIRAFSSNNKNPYDLVWFDDLLGADDSSIIDDYLNGDWSFLPSDELAAALLNTPLADEDGDAIPNWAEYALGLDPTQPDYAVVGQSTIEIEGEEYFQFEYLRTKEAVARGFQFIVEESGNMVFDGSTAVFVGTEDVDSDIERVFYRCSGPMDEVNQCFFRLKVLEPVTKD